MNQLIQDHREQILALTRHYGAHNVRVFGSMARDDAGPDSDVDFLLELDKGRSLLDLSGLQLDLEELLGRKVDITEPETLHWYIRDNILREAQTL